MDSKKIGTRVNPSSPLHLGVPGPEKILREARKNLVSTSSGGPQYSSASQTLGELVHGFSSSNLSTFEEENKLNLVVTIHEFCSFNPTQVDNSKNLF